jgi:hypothetical protein
MPQGHLPSREVQRQRGSWGTSTRNNGDFRPYHLNNFGGCIRGYHAQRFDWLNPRAYFPQFLCSHRNYIRNKRSFDQMLSIVIQSLDRQIILAPFPNIPEEGAMIATLNKSGPRGYTCRTQVRDWTVHYKSEASLGSI